MNATEIKDLPERILGVIATAHGQWSAPPERRRLRAFGFRPAVEEGVLKREWQDAQVRISRDGVTVTEGGRRLEFRAAEQSLTMDGRPFSLDLGRDSAETLIDLIRAYERWIEAREGREQRMQRARSISRDRRPPNALAETRRLQRVLSQSRARARRRAS